MLHYRDVSHIQLRDKLDLILGQIIQTENKDLEYEFNENNLNLSQIWIGFGENIAFDQPC